MPVKPSEPPADATELKAHEVAWLTGLNATTVYKMIQRGDLAAAWTGGRVRVPRSSVEAYLKARQATEAA